MSGRTILITGGSGKFGSLLVAHFLAAGDRVVATVLSDRSLEQAARGHAGSLTVVRADFTQPETVADLVGDLSGRGLQPEGLVNNARSLRHLKTDSRGVVSRDDFTGELLLDVVVPYELTMALALAPDSRLRRVVNIGSQYGVVAVNPGLYETPAEQAPPSYGVAKAALVHLTRELAVRLADRGIQVNCASFGGVEGRVAPAFAERYARLAPQGRMLREDDVVGPVDYLLSDACAAITGHNLVVDGGWTLW
jgi:NAD(P)-dependent dehydrogenase (short-subunit alcohol dehydrogenase family)